MNATGEGSRGPGVNLRILACPCPRLPLPGRREGKQPDPCSRCWNSQLSGHRPPRDTSAINPTRPEIHETPRRPLSVMPRPRNDDFGDTLVVVSSETSIKWDWLRPGRTPRNSDASAMKFMALVYRARERPGPRVQARRRTFSRERTLYFLQMSRLFAREL